LAAAATSIEGEAPGPLSEAARRMARAAQEGPARRNPAAAEVVRDMADTFLSVAFAGTGTAGTLILVREVARLADACAARAATATAQREARQASALVHASLAALTEAAGQQAATTLTTSTRGTGMNEPAHEDELLQTITQAGTLAAQLARAVVGGTGSGTSAAMNAKIAELRAKGYTGQTPYDDLIRDLFGEQRWARYETDKARIAAAAAITDADRVGIYDMKKLLTRAVNRRPWEDDPHSPARSVAEILHYRVTTEATEKHPDVLKQPRQPTPTKSKAYPSRTDNGDSPSPTPAPEPARQQPEWQSPEPEPITPWDNKLRRLLGEDRWHQYAADPRRRDVASLIVGAYIEGHDVDKLLTKVVTMREFEKDPRSPARRVAAVLHYRIEGALADEPAATQPTEMPEGVAAAVSKAKAPPGTGPKAPARTDEAHQPRPVFRTSSRPPEGRDGR
jgi:hypothetical protein